MTGAAVYPARRPHRRRAVAVMARRPTPGRVKTRLGRATGPDTAAFVYRSLLEDTLRAVRNVGAEPVLALAPEDDPDNGWRPPAMTTVDQRGDGLGPRLMDVLERLLDEGRTAAVAVGADTPGLPEELVEDALLRLERGSGAVLGPAFDGGFYLLGLSAGALVRHREELRRLLVRAPLGTSAAYSFVAAGLRSLGIEPAVLPAWTDLDVPDELPVAGRLTTFTGTEEARRDGVPLASLTTGTAGPLRNAGMPLRELYLHVTNRCHGECPHCYVGPPSCRTKPELTTDAWRGVIMQAYELGARSFTFLGGDPFLRADLLELIGDVTSRTGASARLFFARRLGDREAGRLMEAGRGRLLPMLSVDGDRATHDTLRGEGAYERSLATVAALKRAGADPMVNTVLLEPVLPGLPELIADLARHGVTRLHLILPHERGALATRPGMIPGPGLLDALLTAREAAERAGVEIDNFRTWRARLHRPRDLCNAGCSLAAVGPNGEVHACPITCTDPAFVAGDLRTSSFAGIWERSPSLRLLRVSRVRDRSACATCEVVDACGGDCWVQGHYAATRAGRRAGYLAPSPYCDFLRPLFKGLLSEGRAEDSGEGAPEGRPTPFDCI